MGISVLATKHFFERFGTKWSGTRPASAITTIVVHHQAGTNFDNMPGTWQNAQASAHYGIGPDGTIRAYVDELKTAWHANGANGYAIGIECTNIKGKPNWEVSEKTIDALVKLIQDIEKRYGRKMKIIGHRDAPLASTVCPGPFLYSRLPEIRKRVEGTTANKPAVPKPAGLAKNTKPVTKGKVGDTVKVYDALYRDSEGAGRSTNKRGQTGKIKRVVAKGKRYLIENWGWAHANDIQLVVSSAHQKPTATAPATPKPAGWKNERGTFVTDRAINLRTAANPDAGSIATLPKGSAVIYDRFLIDQNGHAWIRQPRANNTFGYLATGESENGKRVNYWGKFK